MSEPESTETTCVWHLGRPKGLTGSSYALLCHRNGKKEMLTGPLSTAESELSKSGMDFIR